MLKNREGRVIASIEDWTRPKRDHQWQPGRSAQELAASWFRDGTCSCPQELSALLDSHELTRGWSPSEGCPEFVTQLPERGEGRNHDLWLRGRSAGGALTVCVEAKADETFGERIGDAIAAAEKTNERSRVRARATALIQVLTGADANPEGAPWRDLRYQLLTAFAGTVLQAAKDRSDLGILVVQEFTGPKLDAERQRQNNDDLDRFVSELFPGTILVDGALAGPRMIDAGPLLPAPVSLLVGKVRSGVAS